MTKKTTLQEKINYVSKRFLPNKFHSQNYNEQEITQIYDNLKDPNFVINNPKVK